MPRRVPAQERLARRARVVAAGRGRGDAGGRGIGEAAGAVIDAGGGASLLAQRLTNAGFTDVTVLDVSAAAMAAGRARPGSSRIRWVNADLLGWKPPRAYQIWHDRAVFHFLVSPADRAAYLATMRAALSGGGAVILAAFAADGPEYCSGLPVARHDPVGLAAELTAAYGDAASWRPGCR